MQNSPVKAQQHPAQVNQKMFPFGITHRSNIKNTPYGVGENIFIYIKVHHCA